MSEQRTSPEAAEAAFVDLMTPEGRDDPYPRYAHMREHDPVHVMPGGEVVLTRYAECVALLRDNRFGVADAEVRAQYNPNWEQSTALSTFGASLLFIDPPDHTRLRRLVSGAFTARRVVELTARVERIIAARLDAMADAGADGSRIDLRDLLAFPLPVAVIGALVGVPEEDWEWLQGPAADMTTLVDLFVAPEDVVRADAASAVMAPYFSELMAARRANPRDDLISALLAAQRETAHDPASGVTDHELLRVLLLLFIAGFETTVNLITNGVVALFDQPDQVNAVTDDPSLAPALVEEVLRYDSPVQATGRFSLRELNFAGLTLAPRTPVLAFLGAANRDPARFPEPDRFDLSRPDTKVASFGGGIHFCLGAPLARLEAQLAFPMLYQRFPKLAPAGAPTRRLGFNLRGFAKVPVTIR
jgi:cytochrome P450